MNKDLMLKNLGKSISITPTHIITVAKRDLSAGTDTAVRYGYAKELDGDLEPKTITANGNSYEILILAFYPDADGLRGVDFNVTDGEEIFAASAGYLIRLDTFIGIISNNLFMSIPEASPDFFTEEDVGKDIPLYFSQTKPTFEFTNISYNA